MTPFQHNLVVSSEIKYMHVGVNSMSLCEFYECIIFLNTSSAPNLTDIRIRILPAVLKKLNMFAKKRRKLRCDHVRDVTRVFACDCCDDGDSYCYICDAYLVCQYCK